MTAFNLFSYGILIPSASALTVVAIVAVNFLFTAWLLVRIVSSATAASFSRLHCGIPPPSATLGPLCCACASALLAYSASS